MSSMIFRETVANQQAYRSTLYNYLLHNMKNTLVIDQLPSSMNSLTEILRADTTSIKLEAKNHGVPLHLKYAKAMQGKKGNYSAIKSHTKASETKRIILVGSDQNIQWYTNNSFLNQFPPNVEFIHITSSNLCSNL